MNRTRLALLAVRGLHGLDRFFVGVGALALFHAAYFRVNLAEVLAPEVERFMLPLYAILALGVLVGAFVRAIRPPSPPLLWLEERLALDFRLINAVRGLSDEPADEVLSGFRPTALLGGFKRGPWLVSALLVLGVAVWHFAAPSETARFLSNARSLVGLQTSPLRVFAPESAREGEPISFRWEGDFEAAELRWKAGSRSGVLAPASAAPVDLEAGDQNLEWALTVRRGRYQRRESGVIRLFQKPKLQSLSARLTDVMGNTVPYTGVSRFEALPGSTLALELGVQAGQEIVEVKGLFPGARWERSAQGARLFMGAPSNLQLALWAVNRQGLSNDAPWPLELSVPENHPPTISLDSPKNPVSLERPAAVGIDFTADDDLALRAVRLMVRSPGKAPLARDLPLPPSARHHVGKTMLEASDVNLEPGQTLWFWLEAEDGWRLTAVSRSNQVHRPSRGELAQAHATQLSEMEAQAERLAREAGELERGASEARLEAERGRLDPARVQALGERLRELRRQARELGNALQAEKERAGATNQEGRDEITPEIAAKLRRLQEALRELDSDTLSKVQQAWSSLVERMGEKPLAAEEWKRALEALRQPQLSERLDNMVKSIEALKQKQGLEDLARLAEAIHQKAEEMRSESLAQDRADPWNRAREDLARELADLRQAWEKNRDKLAPKDEDDPASGEARDELDRDLDQAFEKELAKPMAGGDRFERMEEAARRLDRIRRKLQQLSRRDDELDREKAHEEIARQVAAFLHHGTRALAWMRGELLDLERTKAEVQIREAAGILTESAAFAEQGRLALYTLLAPSMPALVPHLEPWREYEQTCRTAARALDPSGRVSFSAPAPSPELFMDRRREALGLVQILLDLRDLLESMDQEQAESDMQDLSERQQKMGKRARRQMQGRTPTPAQQSYLRELAAEQEMLRRMMEKMGQGAGQQAGQGRETDGGKQAGQEAQGRRKKELDETLEAMKRAEEALRAGGQERERLQADLKKIEENLLKFQSGLKERKDKQDEEYESRSAKERQAAARENGEVPSGTVRQADGRERVIQGAPAEWQERMRAFMEAPP